MRYRSNMGKSNLFIALTLGLMACGDDSSGASTGSSGPGITGGEQTTGGSGDGDSGGDGDDGPARLDLGPGMETDGMNPGGDGGGEGCLGVDVLFVIDNSNSMATKQAELAASVPEFVYAMERRFRGLMSYHIGVVTSDAYEYNADGCRDIGNLVTGTSGRYSSQSPECGPFAEGNRFLTREDDIGDKFECIAKVGIDGDNTEKLMAAATAAVSPDMNAAGACNAGFLRDELVLVLVLVTDEDDPGSCDGAVCPGSEGDPADWYQAIVDAKGGDPRKVVVLSLVRGMEGNICQPPAGAEKDAERIMEFTQMFGDNGRIGDICEDRFGPFFDQAVVLLEEACGFNEG